MTGANISSLKLDLENILTDDFEQNIRVGIKNAAIQIRNCIESSGCSTAGLSDARVLEKAFKDSNLLAFIYYPCCYFFGYEEVSTQPIKSYSLSSVALKFVKKVKPLLLSKDRELSDDIHLIQSSLHLFSYIFLDAINGPEFPQIEKSKVLIEHYHGIQDQELKSIIDFAILHVASNAYQALWKL